MKETPRVWKGGRGLVCDNTLTRPSNGLRIARYATSAANLFDLVNDMQRF